jgi:hypothetical protein
VWDFDVIDLDMASTGVIEISSSCDLSVFPSQANPHCVEGGGVHLRDYRVRVSGSCGPI